MIDKHVYCVRCNSEKTVLERSPVIFRNGAVAVKGKCPSCSSQVFRIVPKEALKAFHNTTENIFIISISMFIIGFAVASVVLNLI